MVTWIASYEARFCVVTARYSPSDLQAPGYTLHAILGTLGSITDRTEHDLGLFRIISSSYKSIARDRALSLHIESHFR